MLPFLEKLEKLSGDFTGTTGIRFQPWPLFIAGLLLLFISFLFMPDIVSLALSIALFLAPLWLPFLLVSGALALWLTLKRGEFIAKQKYILLEIKPPRMLVKTPLAMETFLSTIHFTGGESTWYARWITGSTRAFWSLEIASFEGQVHFFIWARANFRRTIESQLYAQYPGIQIVEAPDYTRLITATNEEWGIWGCDFKHTDKDPVPIKTYVEYGLDKVQKEPEQVDPIANIIEFMSSIGKGEYLWLQFIIRAHKGEKYKKAKGGSYTWKDEAKELVKKIRAETRDAYTDPITGEEHPGFPNPTKGQSEKIAAIERNVSKQAFDVGGRGVYLARPENFVGSTITHLISLFKPFSSEGWNGIRATGWLMKFDDYPWELGAEKLKNEYRRKLIEAYRRRQFFYDPFSYGILAHDAMVMSTEELATIFHIPSQSVQAPGLARVQSATHEAPVNLPT
ncbi:MAG TPA: hypothetical protein PLW99_00255 [Candidatus Paceibacterota bacterium]|nr:MAG: hypothetical protein B7X03_02135 [Parcubacteria group bacterium 21-58-10]HQT82577.1 hypothetical protein [Candidatus Paceibacterota bacterium]